MTSSRTLTATDAGLATGRLDDSSPFALGLLLRRAHDHVAVTLGAAIRPLGIELRHFMVMMRLREQPGLSQKALADMTNHDKVGIVRIVDDLERLGLAERSPVPGDRRVKAVNLTSKGIETFLEAHRAAEPAANAAAAKLSAAQINQLRNLLVTLLTDA